MRTIVYGFFKDEMRGGHNYYDVFIYLFIFFLIDLFVPVVLDPFFMDDNFILLDLIESADVLPFLFLTFIPLAYFLQYKLLNGYAIIQAMFLYVFLLGWIPILYEEFFIYDTFFIGIHLSVLADYLLLHDEDDLDNEMFE